MDGLSAAASIIAVVGLALRSTETVYNAISSIQNGPSAVQQMLSNLQRLSVLLKQLLQTRDAFYLATDLSNLADDCAANLKGFETRLKKLLPSSNSKVQILWVHAKLVVSSKDLDGMSTLIQQHVAALSLQLHIIEGERGVSQIESLERIEVLSNRHLTQHASDSIILRDAATTTNEGIRNLGAILQASNRGTQQLVEQVNHKVQDLSGMSSAQSGTLVATCNAILDLLKSHVSEKPHSSVEEALEQVDAMEKHYEVDVGGKRKAVEWEEDSIWECLDRICQLSTETDKTMFSEDAESLICDLQRLLHTLLEVEGEKSKENEDKGEQDGDEGRSDNTVSQHDDGLKRMKSFLTSSQSIALNGRVSRQNPVRHGAFASQSINYTVQCPIGSMSVRTRRRRRMLSGGQASTDSLEEDTLELWDAQLTFSPKRPQMAQIAIAFQQQLLHHGSFLNMPHLSVSALLPETSKIFEVIKYGDLDDLIKSLSLREAYLTDRDDSGRCLLHYALMCCRPHICKFLIDQGADVDFFEPSCLHSLMEYSFSMKQLAHQQCQKLLLQAGADPTIESPDILEISFLARAVRSGTLEELRALLDCGGAFIGMSETLRPERWLLAHLDDHLWTLESVRFILSRSGSQDLPDQDLSLCLHAAAGGSYIADSSELKATLVLLLRSGADPYEEMGGPLLVSEIVRDPHTERRHDEKDPWSKYLSVRENDRDFQTIWSDALAECGLDEEEVFLEGLRRNNRLGAAEETALGTRSSWDTDHESRFAGLDNTSATSEAMSDTMSWTEDEPVKQIDVLNANRDERRDEQCLLEGDSEIWRN